MRRLAAWFCCLFTLTALVAEAAPRYEAWERVLHRHVEHGRVAYGHLGQDRDFVAALEELSTTDPAALSRADREAFWINAYNAFTMKLIVDHPGVRSIRDIGPKPWDDAFILIGGTRYTLNQIEHEKLRAVYHDPRLHFALVCAARSCPPIRSEPYHGAMLARQLEDQATRFLGDTTKNRYDAASGTLYLSAIFDWYKHDFAGANGSVVGFVERYMPHADGLDARAAVQYNAYDWGLNGQ